MNPSVIQHHSLDRAYDAVSSAASQPRSACTRAEINLDHDLIEVRLQALRVAVDELARLNALEKYRQAA